MNYRQQSRKLKMYNSMLHNYVGETFTLKGFQIEKSFRNLILIMQI